MQKISFSSQFFEVMKKLVSVSKAKYTLMFKQDGRCRITVPMDATFIHLAAGPADLDFDGDEIYLSSFSEFVKYADIVGYPERGEACVESEMSISGHSYEYVKFKSTNVSCRTIMADPTCFGEDERFVPHVGDAETMELIGRLLLGKKQLDSFTKTLKQVPGCEFITLDVDDKIHFYMKGKVAQQINLSYGYPDVTINNPELAKHVFQEGSTLHMFESSYFLTLKGLGYDFETHIRHYEDATDNVTTLKSFSYVPGADENDPIMVYVGGVESESASIANYDLVLDKPSDN